MKNIPSLKKEFKRRQLKTYAYCVNCKTLYLDDVQIMGSIVCPKCPGWAVYRGITQKEVETGQYKQKYFLSANKPLITAPKIRLDNSNVSSTNEDDLRYLLSKAEKIIENLSSEAWGALAWLHGTVQLSDSARSYKAQKLEDVLQESQSFNKLLNTYHESKTVGSHNTTPPERYSMCEDQTAQIDCRLVDCKFHQGTSCTHISPVITLNQGCKFICWTHAAT